MIYIELALVSLSMFFTLSGLYYTFVEELVKSNLMWNATAVFLWVYAFTVNFFKTKD